MLVADSYVPMDLVASQVRCKYSAVGLHSWLAIVRDGSDRSGFALCGGRFSQWGWWWGTVAPSYCFRNSQNPYWTVLIPGEVNPGVTS